MPLLAPNNNRWVTYDAPSEGWYEVALGVLRRKGYKEWRRKSPKTLKERTFTQRRPSLRLYWVETKPFRVTMARRLALLRENVDPQPKYRHPL